MKRFIILIFVFVLSYSVSFAIDMDADKEKSYHELKPEEYGVVIEYLNEKYPDMRTIFDTHSDETMVAYIVMRQLIAVTEDFDVNASYTASSDPVVVYFGYLTTKYDEPTLIFFFQEPSLNWRYVIIIPSRPVISYSTFVGTTEAIKYVLSYAEKKFGDYYASITVRELMFSDQVVQNIINGQ